MLKIDELDVQRSARLDQLCCFDERCVEITTEIIENISRFQYLIKALTLPNASRGSAHDSRFIIADQKVAPDPFAVLLMRKRPIRKNRFGDCIAVVPFGAL